MPSFRLSSELRLFVTPIFVIIYLSLLTCPLVVFKTTVHIFIHSESSFLFPLCLLYYTSTYFVRISLSLVSRSYFRSSFRFVIAHISENFHFPSSPSLNYLFLSSIHYSFLCYTILLL